MKKNKNEDNLTNSLYKKEEVKYFNYNDEDIQEYGLEPEKWMLNALTMNPDFSLWSPYKGYMDNESDEWNGRLIYNNWDELKKDFREWIVDQYNEIIDFHFEVHRKSPGTNRCNLGIALWVLHPRRGCSRGIHVKAIQKKELDKVATTLKVADQQNRKKFSKLY